MLTEDIMRKSALALAALGLFGAVAATLPAPAEAHDWDRGWQRQEWRGRDHHDAGAAIALGVIGGILTGAAVAASHPYAPPAYYPAPGYYAPYAGYGYYR
jgi:hypothetical protein